MGFDLHTVAMSTGSNNARTDRLICWMQSGVTNLVGTAGADVTTAVSFTGEMPATYVALVTPNQDAAVSVTSKTSNGFNVVLTPKLATATIAAGTFDIIVFA